MAKLFILCILPLGFASLACTETSGACPESSSRPVAAFFVEEPGPIMANWPATVESMERDRESGFSEIAVTDSTGAAHVLKFRGGDHTLPLSPGVQIALRLHYKPGSPSTSALILNDENGLLFAAVGALSPQADILGGALADWETSLVDVECAVQSTSCYSRLQEMGLRVVHDGATLVLKPGESGLASGYRVSNLVSRDVEYTSGCADAGLLTVSYVIERVE